jgi:ferrochelatase
MSRIAVVLFNLGGPDKPSSVRPFLKNLFSDPAIIRAPAPVRMLLAEVISRTRERLAKENYAVMGGASPLTAETQAQADALGALLSARRPSDDLHVFVAMRYWRPLTARTAREVAAFAPDHVVLLPLYPQYSTTTTASSLRAWADCYRGPGVLHGVCCYFDQTALADAHAALIRKTWEQAGFPQRVRLLFSAHGLPERISAAGDPYRWQVEQTCSEVAKRLGEDWDWRVCYQSRVGPLRWIGPATLDEIAAAGAEGLGVLVVPIAFVSEHVETLVELDRDYAKAAATFGAQPYLRVPALGTHARYIEGLAGLVEDALASPRPRSGAGRCPDRFARCGLKTWETAA